MFGEAILSITLNNNNVQKSNYGSNSFQITNTGEKNIARIDINVTNALYPDAVFDPFGQAGDTASKPLTIDTDGGTGVVAPSNASYIGDGGTAGFEAIQLLFDENNNNGFEPGETIGFSVDMDPNSVAGTKKGQLDGGSNPPWDVGGVSGAELIGSTFTVIFSDGTTATEQLQGANNQAGSQTLASQDSPALPVSITVNGLNEGSVGTYDASGPSVIINGPAGQTARVVLTKGFIQPVTAYAQFLQNQLDDLAASDFPANNAVEFQTVDVLLTGANQDISNLFDFLDVQNFDFEGEDQLPLGFVASIIDPANNDLPIGPVTQPIYLKFQAQNLDLPPTITTTATVTMPENQTSVLDINATDANGENEGNGLSFSLTGGVDQGEFTINPNIGALSFTSAPDFENPADNDENNVYEVEVTVTDSTNLKDTQLINVTVSDLNETPGGTTIEIENSLDDITVDEDASNTALDLSNFLTDVDNADSAISLRVLDNSNESLVMASINNKNLILDYLPNQSGIAQITIQGESNGQTVEDTFSVTVNSIDDLPSSLSIPINRFQNSNIPGTYLYAGETESQNIRENFSNFIEEGQVFKVAVEPGDDLIRLNRFQNSNIPGTYLYAGEAESKNIRENFPNFIEEGLAFYVYPSSADIGVDFYRFQNLDVPGTYIFVAGEEREYIFTNFPNFIEEGVAFEAEV